MAENQHVHWVDWLKVLAVFGVFVYHSAMVYTYVRWVISNPEHSLLLTLVAGAGFTMGMPLLFVLSGAASFFAFRKLGAARFVNLRFRRLVIPMLAGLVVLSPLQAYLALRSKGHFGLSFPTYLPQFFYGIDAYFSPRWLTNYGYHLWFLGFLFLYSALALPFFSWLGTDGGRKFGGWLAAASLKPGGLLLFVVPPAIVQVALRARFPWYADWADFAYWLMFFAVGYVLVTDRRFEVAIAAGWRRSLVVVVGSAAIIGAFALSGLGPVYEAKPQLDLGSAVYFMARTANTWAIVLLVLALGIRVFDHANRVVGHASEAVLPFYVIHHPVVVLVAFYAVQIQAGVWVKFGLQTAIAFVLTMGLYELAVMPFNPMRALFGLRRKEPGNGLWAPKVPPKRARTTLRPPGLAA